MRTLHLTLSIASTFVLFGCMAGTDDLAASTDPVTLAECRSDADCDRGASCLADRAGGTCVTGRCDSSRDCPEGTVCRGADGLHCSVIERDPTRDPAPETRPEERPAECPRGSIAGYILCAPGFENIVVSRAPHCETCEPVVNTAARCRAAGYSLEECRRLVGGGGDDVSIDERCRAAGYTPEQCRRIWNANQDEDPSIAERCRLAGLSFAECRRAVAGDDEASLADRCRAAGLSVEECRRLTHDEGDDRWSVADRCRAAGLTYDRCRDVVSGGDDATIADRCRAAGFTTDECRRLVSGSDATDGSRR